MTNESTLFWTKMLTGIVFGILTYFIRRFYFEWEFLFAIPLFALVSYVITLIIVILKHDIVPAENTHRVILKTAAAYTGTWFLIYLVSCGLIYYSGW